jgi:hypothetical protein
LGCLLTRQLFHARYSKQWKELVREIIFVSVDRS